MKYIITGTLIISGYVPQKINIGQIKNGRQMAGNLIIERNNNVITVKAL
jgi:hypothetical protein